MSILLIAQVGPYQNLRKLIRNFQGRTVLIVILPLQLFVTTESFRIMVKVNGNRPFPSCFEPHCQSDAKCKFFVMKTSFHSNQTKLIFI